MPARASSSTCRPWPTGSAPAPRPAPLIELIRRHVLAADRVHGDDTTVPVLAKDKTVIGRVWAYVRDDRPFAGPDPPAALFFYSRNRNGEHPNRHLAGYAGILQADAYAGFGDLYDARRRPGPITEAACWSHGRRNFFVLADLGNRRWPSKRCAASTRSSRSSARSTVSPAGGALAAGTGEPAGEPPIEKWIAERPRLSRHAETAKAMDF